eukprot:CAMPEP_0172621116 /NCGR_PEP_ID=MMETSP1068-20121228/109104_1 /TAXON_ID=35684 /ORGANISM="Pseudopedinella elastica, Strain CCMP716" /LENGTH=226 /DNA_ID=CAMNT_0013428705 /DNA_START=88 /DNA_END=768 /DNA_ORIENTATION=+
MHTSEPIANADLKAQKRAMRKEVSKRLANLSEREVESQSSAVAGRLRAMQKVWESSCAEGSVVSAYLPMEGGREVNTFLIIEALCAEGARVAVPKVTGKASQDMRMALSPSLGALRALPLDTWRIPVPPSEWLMESADEARVAVILVPCVALGTDCRRLGHGKGYYDCYIARVTTERARRGLPPPLTVGLALEEQLKGPKDIPVGEHDMELDFVVSSTGVWQRALF